MFAPLEPNTVNGSPENAVQVRCDVACGHFPFAPHCFNLVVTPSNCGQFVEHCGSLSGSVLGTPIDISAGHTISQVEVSLRRDAQKVTIQPQHSGPQQSVAGVSLEIAESLDRASTQRTNSTTNRDAYSESLSEFPQSTSRREGRWRIESPISVASGAIPNAGQSAPVEPIMRPTLEPRATFRTYSESVAAGDTATGVAWGQSLLESARRRDWIWPKVVDELIGRQWSAINQLGRTALGNSREETRRILVTSTKRGEGRTTIALTLARWAAMIGQRTLLIDADIVQPGIASALHISTTGDWRKSSLAFGVENSLITCRSLPLSLLPLTALAEEASAPATLEQLIVQLAVAEQEFDCCILDASSISALCEQIGAVTRLATSLVVVNNHAEGVSHALIAACNLLWQRGKPAIAIADNFRR